MAIIATTRPRAAEGTNHAVYGALDFVPYTPDVAGVIPDDEGFWPRGVRADAAGTLVVWFVDSDAARTLTVAAGDIILGPVVRIESGPTVHLIK